MKPVVYTRPMPGGTTLSVPKIMKSLREDAVKFSIEMMMDFLPSVRTWDKQPKFEHFVEVGGAGFMMIAGTNDNIYDMLNIGTRAHFVAPRNVTVLRFPGVYHAKTTPGLMTSKAGYKGKRMFFSKGHMVSGIKGRNWDITEAKRVEKKLPAMVEKAITRALAESVVSQGA